MCKSEEMQMRKTPVASKSGHQATRLALPLAVAMCVSLMAAPAQALVNLTEDFEAGTNSNFTANNGGTQWAIDSTSEITKFLGRDSTGTSSWSDMYGATNYTDVVMEANVRVNNWYTSTQNRVYLMVRASNVSSTDTLTGYMVSIAPDASIVIEQRAANKAVTVLATGYALDNLGAGWNIGAWNRIRIEASGTGTTKLAIFVNGLKVAEAVDTSSPFTTGRVGFGTAGASADFDDIMVGDADEFRGTESWSMLKTPLPATPLAYTLTKPVAILSSVRSSKVGV